MRLRAQIVIDVDADDFVQAAQHQVRIESFLRELKPDYPSVLLTFRERRAAAVAASESAAPAVKKPTGKLNVYEDPADEA
jgi:hypothetical protein